MLVLVAGVFWFGFGWVGLICLFGCCRFDWFGGFWFGWLVCVFWFGYSCLRICVGLALANLVCLVLCGVFGLP